MPDIYDIDFELQAGDLLPVNKRQPKRKSIIRALLKGLQWSRDKFFGSFKKGATALPWAPGTYNKYDQVVYQKALYEAKATTTNNPSNTTDWMLVQKNFIGMDERVLYNGQKIVLEYALNKEFGGVFRQPITGINSDIYINNLAAVLNGFRIGNEESMIGQTGSNHSIGALFPYVYINNFQINVPVAIFATTNEQAIRNFVNLYLPISINYTIVTY